MVDQAGVKLQAIHHAALALGPGVGRRQQQIEASVELVWIAQVAFDGGAGQDVAGLDHRPVGPQVGEGQHLPLAAEHIDRRHNAHHPAAGFGEHLFKLGHIAFGHQKDLAIGWLTRQDPREGIEIGLLQQCCDHAFGLVGPGQGHLGAGQGLAAGDHHVTPAQGDQIELQVFEFFGSGGNPGPHLGQFGFVAADVGIAGLHIAPEPIALHFQAAALG